MYDKLNDASSDEYNCVKRSTNFWRQLRSFTTTSAARFILMQHINRTYSKINAVRMLLSKQSSRGVRSCKSCKPTIDTMTSSKRIINTGSTYTSILLNDIGLLLSVTTAWHAANRCIASSHSFSAALYRPYLSQEQLDGWCKWRQICWNSLVNICDVDRDIANQCRTV